MRIPLFLILLCPAHLPQQLRKAHLLADYYRLYGAIGELKQMDFFQKTDDDPKTAIFMSVFDSMGRLYEAGNDLFEKSFLTSVDFLEDSCQNKTVNTLLFAALVAPEDRIIWFRTALEVCMTSAFRSVQFIKVRKGKMGEVCVSSVSRLLLPPPPSKNPTAR